MRDQKTQIIKYLMFLLHAAVIFYIAILIYVTTFRICQFNQARDFLDTVVAIPQSPFLTLVWSAVLLSGLLCTFLLREYAFREKATAIFISLALDILLIIALMAVLNYNYNGLVFWVVANFIYHAKGKSRYLIMLPAVFSYACSDYQLLFLKYRIFSIEHYFGYYPAKTQQLLLSIHNLLNSATIIVFIIFCIFVIQEQRGMIEEINMLYSQLKKTNHTLKELADVKEIMGQTKERNRLAREIHDTLGHTLTGIAAGLDACMTTISIDTEQTKEQLRVLANVTREGLNDVRRSVRELIPDSTERFDLEYTLAEMIGSMISVTGTDIVLSGNVDLKRFDEDEASAVFRIIQESITNAIRHGKAGFIDISLEEQGGQLILDIKDNGCGCMDFKKGFGTGHMQEQVERLQGTVTFSGENGFRVLARIPLRWGKSHDKGIDC